METCARLEDHKDLLPRVVVRLPCAPRQFQEVRLLIDVVNVHEAHAQELLAQRRHLGGHVSGRELLLDHRGRGPAREEEEKERGEREIRSFEKNFGENVLEAAFIGDGA